MAKHDTVLAGFHAVSARLKKDADSISAVYVDPERKDRRMSELLEQLHKAGVRVMRADAKRLDGFSEGIPHQGVIALAAELDLGVSFDSVIDSLDEKPLLLILDGVTDPRNLGACLRVADAAGVKAVIAPKDRSASLTPAAVKASAGASETVPLVRVTNLATAVADLVAADVLVVGTAGEADKTIYQFDQTGAFAWVLGAEDKGMRLLTRRRCSALARIPMFGSVESLNVSVAAGICLYESVRQRYGTAP